MKALMLLCSLVTVIPAAHLNGKVVGVKGGNSVEILNDGKVLSVKIYGVDCPAKTGHAGQQARHYVADAAFMSDVQLEVTGTESDGNLIGKIILSNGKDLGEELIRNGMAWWDKHASPEAAALAKIEKQARDAFMGIWAGNDEEDDTDWGKDVLVKREQADKADVVASR